MPEIPFKTVAGFITVVVVIGCIMLLSKPGFDLESTLYFSDSYEDVKKESLAEEEDDGSGLSMLEIDNHTVDETENFIPVVHKQIHCPPCPEITLPTKDHIDPDLKHAVYRDVRPFLLSTPQTVTLTQPPLYMTGVKNPCFAMDKNYINIGGINLTTAMRLKYHVRCMPGAYLAGFSKAGTTDFHSKLAKHPLLWGVATSRKLDKFSQQVGDENYRNVKETHFWDNRHCQRNRTMDRFSNLCGSGPLVHAYKKYGWDAPYNPNKPDDLREMLFIESTPRQSWHHDSWNEEQVHYLRQEPHEFTPDRIHHSTPAARLIFLVRDPVSRTFSDYRYLTAKKDYHSAEDFHRKVVESISWWKNCTARYPMLICAYGNAPPGLPFHTAPSCGLQAIYKHFPICDDYKSWGSCGSSVDRFRVSMYSIFLREWLRVFPRENVLIIKSEEMFTDRMGSMNRTYEFLGLPPLPQDIYDMIANDEKNTNKSKDYIVMLEETKKILEKFFKPFNEELAKLLMMNKPFW